MVQIESSSSEGSCTAKDSPKAGQPHVAVPVYSHLTCDILQDQVTFVDRPDVVIIEG